MVDYKTGGHSVYEMKYHFVWVTKYRYHILTGEIAHRVREIIRQCCLTRDITIIKGSIGKDHIHLLLGLTTPFWENCTLRNTNPYHYSVF